jgi:hypothetical protein
MDDNFWVMDYWPEDHEEDLLDSELACIVDEEAGGIIAYAVNWEEAEKIANALSQC